MNLSISPISFKPRYNKNNNLWLTQSNHRSRYEIKCSKISFSSLFPSNYDNIQFFKDDENEFNEYQKKFLQNKQTDNIRILTSYDKQSDINAKRIFLTDNSLSYHNKANIVWVEDKASADSINADYVYMRNHGNSKNISSKNLFMRDNSYTQCVATGNAVLKGNSYIEECFDNTFMDNNINPSGAINLSDNSYINDLYTNKLSVKLEDNSKINKLNQVLPLSLSVIGTGSIGKITTAGKKILLNGPLKIDDIEFKDEFGTVIIKKSPYLEYPKINSENIKNGDIKYVLDIQNEHYIDNLKDTFYKRNSDLINHIDNLQEGNLVYKKLNNDKLSNIEQNDQFVIDTLNLIKNNKSEFIDKLKNDKNYSQKLLNTKINNKKIYNIWLNNFNIKTDGIPSRLKINELLYLIQNKDNISNISNITENEILREQTSINSYKLAYNDLFQNKHELSPVMVHLLDRYKDNATLYNVAVKNVNNNQDIYLIESSIFNILTLLENEHTDILKKTKGSVFNEILNTKNILNPDKSEKTENNIDFIFQLLKDKAENSSKNEANEIAKNIKIFQTAISSNPAEFEFYWKKITDDSFNYFKTDILDEISDNNLKLLKSIQKNTELDKTPPLNDLINGSYFDKIEQKEFVARYQYNNEFDRIMNNTGINRKDIVSKFLQIETLNKNVYTSRLNEFCRNITKENVENNIDIADKMLEVLNKDTDILSLNEKYNILNNLSENQKEIIIKDVYKKWIKTDLNSFMNNQFVNVETEYSINAQGRNIRDELKNVNANLLNITEALNNQTYILQNMAQNIDMISDINEAEYKQLCNIACITSNINQDTRSIKANTRAILYSAMENSKIKDPQLAKEIESLLPDIEKGSFKDFIGDVNKKCKEIKNKEHRKKLLKIAGLIALATVTGVTIAACPPLGAAGATGFAGIANTVGAAGSIAGTEGAMNPALLNVAQCISHAAVLQAFNRGFRL